MTAHVDVLDLVARLKEAEKPFVLATVVRTISVTAAKAGAKAIIGPDGRIEAGWIGGGCARGAVLKAAREAFADGCSRLISIQPQELLQERDLRPGEDRDGIRFARNMCPSKGTMDIFIEPVLPRPSLVVMGASPVAMALVAQAPQFGFHVTLAAPSGDLNLMPDLDIFVDGFAIDPEAAMRRFIVVSTQGKGDEAALKSALAAKADYLGFVGSRRKVASLREGLKTQGFSDEQLDVIKGPAGLDLGAITPDEIAMSIMAEITQIRRAGQRRAASS